MLVCQLPGLRAKVPSGSLLLLMLRAAALRTAEQWQESAEPYWLAVAEVWMGASGQVNAVAKPQIDVLSPC